MDNWTALEAAFKNGYDKGYEAGQKEAMIKFLTEYGAELKKVVEKFDTLLENLKAE